MILAIVAVSGTFLIAMHAPNPLVAAHAPTAVTQPSLDKNPPSNPHTTAGTSACGSLAGSPASPELMPAICVSPQILCDPGTAACGSHPDQARVTMWANATGNSSFLPWVQVVFVVETTTEDGVYDSSQGDYGDGVNGASSCKGPCEESVGVPYFVSNIAQIAQGITEKNVGVASSSHVTFSMVDYFSTLGKDHDDGDGSEYNIDVSTFEPASTFASAVTSLSGSNALFGDYWEHVPEVYDDSDFSDNFLSSSMITALYGGLHGSGLSWITNSSTYHVIVQMGSTLPRDPNYQGDYCVTYNDWATSCPNPTSTSEPAYTYASGLTEPAGETVADIETLAQQEHVLIDTIDLPDGMTELGGGDLLNNTAAHSSASANDVKQILSAGCDLAQATGGSWEGPTPGYSGVDFRCSAAATGTDQGNLTNTFRQFSGGTYGWSSDPSLGWALTNIKFPPTHINYSVIAFTHEETFQFTPSNGFAIDPAVPFTFKCTNNGTVITGLCQRAWNASIGGTGWGWGWPLSAVYPDDSWSVSFLVNVTNPYPVSQLNQSWPVDACQNTTFWTGCSGPSGSLYSWAFYNNISNIPVTQSFPPAYVDVISSGSVATLASVSVSPGSSTLSGGAYQTFTATPACNGGTCPSGTTFAWTMSNASLGWLNTFSGASVVFTAGGTSGTEYLFVNATLYGLTQMSSPVPITISPSVILTGVTVAPNPVSLQVGTSQGFGATPLCSGPCSSGVTYSWTLTNSLGNLTTYVGSYVTFNAGNSAGRVTIYVNATLNGTRQQSMPDNITITTTPPPALSAVAINPNLALVATGGLVNFTAIPLCGTTACGPSVVYLWSLTSSALGSLNTTIGSMVAFTAATSAGNVSLFVNATLAGVTQQSRPATIEIQTTPVRPLVSVAISPSSDTLLSGQSQTFAATANCTTAQCPPDVVYTWSSPGKFGTLNSTMGSLVTFKAGSTGGTFDLTVNASYESDSVLSPGVPITVTSTAPVLTGVSVIPSSANLTVGMNYAFTAVPTCTDACGTGTVYTWTLTSSKLGTLGGQTGTQITFFSGKSAGNLTLFVNGTLGSVTKRSAPVPIVIAPASSTKGALESVSISPSSVSLATGASRVLSAEAVCGGSGCPATITYNWELSSSLGSFQTSQGATATFVAGNVSGKVTVTVVAALNGKTANGTAEITIQGTTSSSGSGGLPTILIAMVIVGAAVAVLVVLAVVKRRKDKETPPQFPPIA